MTKEKTSTERVTAPTQSADAAELQTTVETAQSAARQKDPKKVAAGRAGAAARKAKQEKILAELREAKASIQRPSAVTEVTEQRPPAEAVRSHRRSEAYDKVTNGTTDVQWTPWIVGGLGLAGVVWLLHSNTQKRAVTSAPSVTAGTAAAKSQKTEPLAKQPPAAAQQLKTHRDPFHME